MHQTSHTTAKLNMVTEYGEGERGREGGEREGERERERERERESCLIYTSDAADE